MNFLHLKYHSRLSKYSARARASLPASRTQPNNILRGLAGASPYQVGFTDKFPNHRERGMLLFECLVYFGLFILIIGLAFKLFISCWDNSKGYRRNADQILNTLRAGERWREDVRTATAGLRVDALRDGAVLRIPQQRGEISYHFADGALWRRANPNAEWTKVLGPVKSSRMEADKRTEVTAWRWEVELLPPRKNALAHPLFTFEAVPPKPQ